MPLTADEKRTPGFDRKLKKCVKEVKAGGEAVNPYAVCRASLRESAGLKTRRKA